MTNQPSFLAETILEINWKAIQHNIAYFKSKLKTDTQLMVMLKASAYGSGAVQLAQKLEKEQLCSYIAVAYPSEGVELRKSGITLPIMILNPGVNTWEELTKHCLEPEIHNIDLLKSFAKFLSNSESIKDGNYPIHLKFNTGMNRLGIDEVELGQLKDLLTTLSSIQVKSVMTHLSSAGILEEEEFTRAQLDQFDRIKKELYNFLPQEPIAHALNSFGIERYPEYQYDMVRLGIGMYGAAAIDPLNKALVPICKLKASISAIRKVKKGDSISYSRSGKAPSDGYVATLSLGYADGMNRNLGNGKWEVEIGGKLYPTIGNICMDLCMVFLGNDEISYGTEAIIFGGQKTIYEFAEAQKTITYEALTNIGTRVKKVLIN